MDSVDEKEAVRANPWNLDPKEFRVRVPVGDRCLVTDLVGWEHMYTARWLCHGPESAAHLVESGQAYWVELNDAERAEYVARQNADRPWWKKLLGLGKL